MRNRKIIVGGVSLIGIGSIYLLLTDNADSVRIEQKLSASTETKQIPSRAAMLHQLRTVHHDILIIGGGSTGTGAALDAASRGLRVALVEREDFSSGTSSRSTKLIWGGSRYLVQAGISLLNPDLRLLFKPMATVRKFSADFNMVLNCHRERKFMLEKQPHLTNWLPIAVPITKWILWPPPFNFWPAALGPMGLFPLFFKFYDSLSWFSSPPSHIMWRSRTVRKFPQLNSDGIKYCSIFYEGQHDDARTNLALAETAAVDGAAVLNYTDVVSFIRDQGGDKIIGAVVQDRISGETFRVLCKSVLMCGGPFTDELRHMEDPDADVKRAVKGASGIHIVLPSYYAPKGIGLLDMNTSDGRFLFLLPWEGHVLIGTTDAPCEPNMRPEASEKEIQWVLKEAGKYLNPEVKLRREDVLSAWSGIRPLAMDPHAGPTTSSVSRDHLISHNPRTGVVFISGGKWTTYREMAQDAIDKVISAAELVAGPCRTLDRHLVGYEGYSSNLPIQLVQEFDVAAGVAEHLAKAYGGRARDVLTIARDEMQNIERGGLLASGYPYLLAEIVYAARFEWALHANDVLARRTRLAFLNKKAALVAIPLVVDVMANELKWSVATKIQETERCLEYLKHFGGSAPVGGVDAPAALATEEVAATFRLLDHSHTGKLGQIELMVAADILGVPLSAKEANLCTGAARGGVSAEEFKRWWNASSLSKATRIV